MSDFPQLPEIHDGDQVECYAKDPQSGQSDFFEGTAIFEGGRLVAVETEFGCVAPDPRFPVELLSLGS